MASEVLLAHESLPSQAHTGFSIFTNSNFALFPWPKDFTK